MFGSQLYPELCPCGGSGNSGCIATTGTKKALSVQSAVRLRLTAISNRSSVRAVCGVCTSGSQPSPTGALSVQSAVFTPPAHSHLQPELCPCSRHSHLQPHTSGSQPSPTGALSVQSAVFTPPAHSHLQPELCSCSL